VVQVDPSLMLQISLRQAVARRFQDEAISVREAAVTLVGCYVLQDPKVASAFHSSLITRLGDVGVSVRRRVVRIFRDLLISQPGYSGRVDVCRSMLQRAANPREEEGVRHDIKTMFKELWFDEEILRKSNSSMHGASDDLCVHDVSHESTAEISKDNMCKEEASGKVSKVPTIFPRRKNDVEARIKDQRFRDIVTQMVDVIAVSTDTGFLENMVKELFLICEDHEDSKMIKCSENKAIADYYCSNLVAALFEELLQFEEQRCRNARRDGDSRLVSIMVTIGIFCEAVPGLLAPHIDTLLPYLKADNLLSLDDEAKILIIICRLIVKLVSSVLPLADVQRLVNGSVSDDLEKITHKFGSVASAAAVEALAVIASRTGSSGDQRAENNLMKLAATFYGYLYKVKDMTSDYSTTTKGVQSNLKRALSVLQAVCQYYASNQHSLLADPDLGTDADPLSFPYLQPSLLSFSNLLDACFAAFSFYLGKEDIPTKCAALNAMSGVFLARPRTMLIVEKNGIFADLFSESMPPLVQLESLRCWKNILSAEEWRVESGRARERMDQNADVTLSKRISGDQDGDSSIAGSVLTQHTKRIYQLAKSPYAAIRLAAVDLVGLLLRQGLINPLETVPHLLALQGEPLLGDEFAQFTFSVF
jgi:cohesin loading factor subunit SCC2